ncbi:hypothetical protein [Levilactobacillus humaensis]|uniref:hypothetical protein n=1 Tax=Levilactobacillus humaensis TaxID=2950375 RepID=UPI0021C4631F|nr:hypothetical protein [Levilactobacillus humaensis]
MEKTPLISVLSQVFLDNRVGLFDDYGSESADLIIASQRPLQEKVTIILKNLESKV